MLSKKLLISQYYFKNPKNVYFLAKSYLYHEKHIRNIDNGINI